MDVVFVVDDTGSMGGALCNVKIAIAALIDQIACASGDDFQLGLLTFKDDVVVLNDLAAGNRDAVEAHVQQLFASGGNGGPEASDEALNTAINGLDEADRDPGQQTGDFDGTWRPGAVKIAILITDAPPAGFDDQYTIGIDDVNAHARALEAAAAGIQISAVFVPTAGNYSGQVEVMQDYAATTGGLYLETAPDGAGTALAIDEVILSCGGSCGDGIVDRGEQCDDANAEDGDGCDAFCRQSITCPVLPPDSVSPGSRAARGPCRRPSVCRSAPGRCSAPVTAAIAAAACRIRTARVAVAPSAGARRRSAWPARTSAGGGPPVRRTRRVPRRRSRRRTRRHPTRRPPGGYVARRGGAPATCATVTAERPTRTANRPRRRAESSVQRPVATDAATRRSSPRRALTTAGRHRRSPDTPRRVASRPSDGAEEIAA